MTKSEHPETPDPFYGSADEPLDEIMEAKLRLRGSFIVPEGVNLSDELIDDRRQQTASERELLTPSQEIAVILSNIGEDLGFDPETVAEITGLPFEEAFEKAYSYLTSAELDADEILTTFLEEPDDHA